MDAYYVAKTSYTLDLGDDIVCFGHGSIFFESSNSCSEIDANSPVDDGAAVACIRFADDCDGMLILQLVDGSSDNLSESWHAKL